MGEGGGGGWGWWFFFFKQKTAYEMCGRDWSSDVCSSDLLSRRSAHWLCAIMAVPPPKEVPLEISELEISELEANNNGV